MRFIVDTNVAVSAALFENSIPDRAFRLALQNGSVLLSLEVLHELGEVLNRPKFDRYLQVEERENFLMSFVERAELIDTTSVIEECRDPKDNKFLVLAVDGAADFIITGDDHLLELHPFRGISILTPRSFLEQFPER